MHSKSYNLGKTLWALLCCTCLTTAAFAKPTPANTKVELSGKIIGPIATGQAEDGTQIKSFHLKLNHVMEINDEKSSCGLQKIEGLPILVENMKQYNNKNVKIKASIHCIESKLGSYAIDRLYSVKLIK